MSIVYEGVELRVFEEASFTCRTLGNILSLNVSNSKLSFSRQADVVKEICLVPDTAISRISQKTVIVVVHKGCQNDVNATYFVTFESRDQMCDFLSSSHIRSTRSLDNSLSDVSTFDRRTDSWSAVQYFQFYGYLSQQQNMMQDFVRTSTYQRAMLNNSVTDFRGKVVLDVGAGSGILSFFAIQAGAKKVYAVEASNMAANCDSLVQANKLAGRIVVISGKIEDVTLPEPVDVIISEPIGYMLFNERMLESYVHARKFLKNRFRQPKKQAVQSSEGDDLSNTPYSAFENSDENFTDCLKTEGTTTKVPDESEFSSLSLLSPGIMFPTVANLYIVPFSDEVLFAEQHAKANFWYQQNFHGMDLSALRNAAVTEYFNQPIVDTFDIGICPAFPCVHKIDFRTVSEAELASIDIPLHYHITTCSTIHGLAFWFDVGFLGSQRDVWLSTAPTEPLTHWYQVRCLFGTPLFVQEGQSLNGRLVMQANSRQSYDVRIELIIPGSQTKITNNLDLKNPHFRYNGYPPAPPPGSHSRPPTETYYANLCAQQQMELQTQTVVAGSNPLTLAAATVAAPGSGVFNLRPSQAFEVNTSHTGLVGGNPYTTVQANPNTFANSHIHHQTQSMQLSPQPTNNATVLELGKFVPLSQVTPVLKPNNPIEIIDPLTNFTAMSNNESLFFDAASLANS